MDENDLYGLLQGLDPETRESLIQAVLSQPRQGYAQREMGLGENLLSMPAEGRGTNLGYTYVAASPLTHLADAIRTYRGIKGIQQGQQDYQNAINQQGGGIGAMLNLLQRQRPMSLNPLPQGPYQGQAPQMVGGGVLPGTEGEGF